MMDPNRGKILARAESLPINSSRFFEKFRFLDLTQIWLVSIHRIGRIKLAQLDKFPIIPNLERLRLSYKMYLGSYIDLYWSRIR